jgi:hypothetical protein
MAYEMENFAELADNGLLSCTAVVGANSRKRDCLGVFHARALGLIDWWDQATSLSQIRGYHNGYTVFHRDRMTGTAPSS